MKDSLICLTPYRELMGGKDKSIYDFVQEDYSAPDKVIAYLKTKAIDYWNDEVETFNGEKSFGEETIDIDDPVKKKEQNLKEMIENIVAAIRDIKQLNERVAELNRMRTDEKEGPGSTGSIIYLSKNKDTLTDIYDGKQVIVSSRDIVEKIIRSRTYNTK